MNLLEEQTIFVGGRACSIRTVATRHHLIVQAREGREPVLELHVSRRACAEGLVLPQLHGDISSVAQELTHMLQLLLAQGSPGQGVASTPS
jgi:hypothetical protein